MFNGDNPSPVGVHTLGPKYALGSISRVKQGCRAQTDWEWNVCVCGGVCVRVPIVFLGMPYPSAALCCV